MSSRQRALFILAYLHTYKFAYSSLPVISLYLRTETLATPSSNPLTWRQHTCHTFRHHHSSIHYHQCLTLKIQFDNCTIIHGGIWIYINIESILKSIMYEWPRLVFIFWRLRPDSETENFFYNSAALPRHSIVMAKFFLKNWNN